MKKLFVFVLTVLMIFGGCSNEHEGGKYNPKTTDFEINETYDENAPVEMNILSVSEAGITVEFVNTTEMEGLFGEHFYICFEQDGKWYRLPQTAENIAFTDIGYILEPNGKADIEHGFEWIYGLLPEGKYRIVKDITLYKDLNSREREKYILAAEFVIE